MNNIKPRTRFERDQMANRDTIEHQLINNRGGHESRNVECQALIYNADQ